MQNEFFGSKQQNESQKFSALYIDDILGRPEKIVKSALAAITPKKKTVGADKKEVGISWHDIVRRDDIKQ